MVKLNYLIFLQVLVFSLSEDIDDYDSNDIDNYDSEEFENLDGKYEYDDILVKPSSKNASRANGPTFSYLPTSPYGMISINEIIDNSVITIKFVHEIKDLLNGLKHGQHVEAYGRLQSTLKAR